jgi:hypothetical protein
VGAILTRFEEKIARSEQLRQAHLAAVAQKAGEEGKKVGLVAMLANAWHAQEAGEKPVECAYGSARRQRLACSHDWCDGAHP